MENENNNKNRLFSEIITSENVLRMSEAVAVCETKYQIQYNPDFMIRVYNNLIHDINHKHNWRYQLSDSYDLVQEVGLFLCQHIGERLSDTYRISKKGNIVTIQMQAQKEMMKLLRRKYRDARTQYNIDDIYETAYTTLEVYDEEPEEDNFDYDKFNEVVTALNLNEMQITALRCRLNGMSYPQIALVIKRCLSSTHECIQKIIKKCIARYGE